MVHLYYYFRAQPDSQFSNGAVCGYHFFTSETREEEVNDQVLRGKSIAFLDSAMNDPDTPSARARTISAPGPCRSK